ncbi:MAG: hypothetical protein QNJ13_02255 [Paracoccaceae bacterium]|nr:hypothetical protein [Paracoccaceae bacterium]
MHRLLVLLLLASGPAQAWDFSPVPVCTLSRDGPTPVEITFDPRADEPYAISVTSDAPWPAGTVFGIRFEGPRGLTIRTDRYRLSADGRRLTVTDRGFGNVLNGLEFNAAATLFAGRAARQISLAGAAGPVRAFRACISAPVA